MKYKVYRWDPVLIKNNINPYPVLYIKPDKRLLEFAKKHKFRMDVVLNGSGTPWDGMSFKATLNSSLDFPTTSTGGKRVNFYNATGLYNLTLDTVWSAYPPQLGSVIVPALGAAPVPVAKGNPLAKPSPPPSKPVKSSHSSKSGLSASQLVALGIGLVLLLLFIIVLVLTLRKR